MSDLEKELPEIPLPKPKKKVKTKAKQSAKQAIARTRKKVAKAEHSTFSQSSCQNVKDKLLTIDKVLDGKEQQLITQDVIEDVPENIQEHLASQNIIFKPNDGPQRDFLAASEREVFLRWCKRWW